MQGKSYPNYYTRLVLTLLLAGALAPVFAAPPPATPPAPLTDTTEMIRETRDTVHSLEWQHYLKIPLMQIDQRELLRAYMENLDERHLFLLQPDVTGFQDQFAPTLVHNLKELGNLDPAYAIFTKFQSRLHERVAWINKFLDSDIDLAGKDTFQPDRTDSIVLETSSGVPSPSGVVKQPVFNKVDWPATQADADKLWSQQIRYEVINEMLVTETRDIDAANQKAKDAANPPTASTTDKGKTTTPTPASGTTTATSTGTANTTASTTPAKPKTRAEKTADAKTEVRKAYNRMLKNLDETDAIDVQDIFLNTLAMQYDPHSSFFTQNGLDDFDITMRNSLIGIGCMLQLKDEYCTVSDLVPGGPALESNLLHPGDKIVAVGEATGDLVDVVDTKLNKTVSLIRGKEGTQVRLQIIPASDPSGAEKKIITLVRKEIKITTTLCKARIIDLPMGDKTVPIGVIDLPTFYGKNGQGDTFSTTDDVRELIGKLKTAGVQGLILDVRQNGGGFLNEAIDLTGLFIPPSPVLQVQDALGFLRQMKSEDVPVVWDGPLMVLVSKQSASATEIMTGALQDYHRALVVGDHTTHGKGTVQQVFNFDVFDPTEKGAAKVTIEKWYLPDGNSIQSRGVIADISLPSDIDFEPSGEGDTKNAMKWDSVKPAPLVLDGDGPWRASLVNDTLITKLREESQARQNSLDEFTVMKKRIDWEKSRWFQKDYSLNFDLRMKQRLDDISFRDDLRQRLSDLAKNNFKSTDIMLDAAKDQQKDLNAKKPTTTLNADGTDEPVDEADLPIDFDIQLREGLRIMGDWLNMSGHLPDGKVATTSVDPATSTATAAPTVSGAPATATH